MDLKYEVIAVLFAVVLALILSIMVYGAFGIITIYALSLLGLIEFSYTASVAAGLLWFLLAVYRNMGE